MYRLETAEGKTNDVILGKGIDELSDIIVEYTILI